MVEKISENLKLELKINSEGLYICGNEIGLKEFARLLQQVSEGNEFHHAHLSFSWRDILKFGDLIIDFEYLKGLKVETPIKKEVTVMKTEKIGNDLWGHDAEEE